MITIESFVTADWISEVYPVDDSSVAVTNLKDFFDASFEKNRVVYISEKDELYNLIDILDQLCKEKSETNGQVDSVIMLCSLIDNKLKHINEKSQTSIISLGNEYFLNTESLPTAVRFLKYLRQNNAMFRRMSRKYLESKYIEYQNDQKSYHKFSTILFALSWMNILSVHNSTYITLNHKNKKFFE